MPVEGQRSCEPVPAKEHQKSDPVNQCQLKDTKYWSDKTMPTEEHQIVIWWANAI